MNRFKANQKLLFKAETVFNLRPLEKYEILFSFLDTLPLEILYLSTGRPPNPYEALLKALIYKNIKNVSYLSDLARELQYDRLLFVLSGLPGAWYLLSGNPAFPGVGVYIFGRWFFPCLFWFSDSKIHCADRALSSSGYRYGIPRY